MNYQQFQALHMLIQNELYNRNLHKRRIDTCIPSRRRFHERRAEEHRQRAEHYRTFLPPQKGTAP
jgi:hypothetical protein